MSLYHDAVTIISGSSEKGSLKSRVFNEKSGLKSKPAHLYALISETAKYDELLKEVIDRAGILALEPKLNSLLSLFLVHDYLFSKKGIATPSSHPFRQAIEKHKARLQAEFTKARLRRGCTSIEELKNHLVSSKSGAAGNVQPRWVRVNRIKTTVEKTIEEVFSDFTAAESLAQIISARPVGKMLYRDEHIPDVLAVGPDTDLTRTKSYKDGHIILQDKASCFPAYLLLGSAHTAEPIGDIIDACAAPGNKTTHLAAIMSTLDDHGVSGKHKIFASERDTTRSKTLEAMVTLSGANTSVTVLAKQDFLALNPNEHRFKNVTHLLLDPSCSGSGIVGRVDIPVLALPADPVRKTETSGGKREPNMQTQNSKKRKRDGQASAINGHEHTLRPKSDLGAEEIRQPVDQVRLEKLSNLQTRIIEHAFSFPAARKITYSTCSVYFQENEGVVARVLKSRVANERKWRILKRDAQVEGLKKWEYRGTFADVASSGVADSGLDEDEAAACIRCYPDTSDGTMGFFVCAFVRDEEGAGNETITDLIDSHVLPIDDGDNSWDGFPD